MSLIEFSLIPPSDLDVDYWMIPEVSSSIFDLLDIFDPFDLSRIGNRIEWIVQPDWVKQLLSQQLNSPTEKTRTRKYRIAVDIRGINKQSVHINVSDDKKKLIVSAKEGDNYQHISRL